MEENSSPSKTMKTEINSTEPPWGGFERSAFNLLVWILLVLGIMPLILGTIAVILWEIGTGFKLAYPIAYALGLFFGSISLMKAMEKKGRLYKVVKSQTAVLITFDLPSSASREASDSQEKTTQVSVKLGEGLHIMNPFDQEYAILSIENDYQVTVPQFRVSIGDTHKKDLLVKTTTANFETDSECLLKLARISLDETKRKENLENLLRSYIERFTEEECRAIAKDGADPADKSDVISKKVEERIELILKEKQIGVKLKHFTLGNFDKPTLVETARDQAASIDALNVAAANLLKLNDGVSIEKQISPQEAIDQTLIAAGIKKSERKETFNQVDAGTVRVIGDVAKAIIETLKKR